MPYIDYDENGNITGRFANQQFEGQIYTDLVIDDVEKFKVIKKVVTDISNTDEYKAKIAEIEEQIQAQKNITKRQMLIWLFTQKGKTEDDILTVIDAIEDSAQKYLAKVNYSGTNNFYYGNKFVPVIGQALGLNLDEIKRMFDESKNL